jgi:flagellar motility protein MotE (MotC chaperone)
MADRLLRLMPLTIIALTAVLALKLAELSRDASLIAAAAEETAAPAALPASALANAPAGPTDADQALADQPTGAAAPPTAAPPAAVGERVLPPVPEGAATKSDADARGATVDLSNLSEAELAVLANLATRRDALKARADELQLRENLLAAAEKRLEERVSELKKIEAHVQGLIRQHDADEEKNLKSLVKVYENMKPKDAARIFEKLDMPVLLGVVERMKEAKLAPVLAVMDAGHAQRITIELATRRQLPETAQALAPNG